QLNKDDTWVNLLNSCTTQYSYLRNSLLFNLIKAVVRNLDNFVPVIKIFEIGTVFLRNGVEQVHFAFALTVPHVELNYLHGDSQPSLDFMVNFYQACLKILLRDKLPTFQKTKNRYLDFGFEVLLEGSRIGCLGAVSPSLLATLDSKLPIMYGEIYLNSVLRFESQFDNLLVQAGIPPRAISVNEMPPSYRDLTIPCHDVPVGEIIRLLKSNFEDVAGILVVDRLCGKNVTLRIYFKGREKPLTKEQVDSSFERIRLFIEQAA
ncbi:MAG: hypothetical protein NZO16_07195, partial [Deltaproteobacteria bacterium]|nr:hypothetical protein [Deltaproteobacteria bacterium]